MADASEAVVQRQAVLEASLRISPADDATDWIDIVPEERAALYMYMHMHMSHEMHITCNMQELLFLAHVATDCRRH